MSTIILKNSSEALKVPLPGDLTLGELAINTTDGKIYMKNGAGSVIDVSGSSEWILSGDDIYYDTGNVGIGNSSLESWSSTYTAVQVGGNSSIMSTKNQAAGGSLYSLQNAYFASDESWKYVSTDEASIYYQLDGTHTFLVAASGTADTVISWTSAMVIDNNGVVDIAGDTLRVSTQKTPASATAAGVKGDIVHDTNYIYVCTATNVWKRSALSTW